MVKERLLVPEHWWDVHLFIDETIRVSVARYLGGRDRAHQLAAELNRIEALLSRPKSVGAAEGPAAVD